VDINPPILKVLGRKEAVNKKKLKRLYYFRLISCPNNKAMAGLPPASNASTVLPRHVPVATVNSNGTITATVCVLSADKEYFVKLASNVIGMGCACRGDITIQPTSVTCQGTYQGKRRYSLKLRDGKLNFTFHDAVGADATGLLQKAWDAADAEQGRANVERIKKQGLDAMLKDSRSGANGGALCIKPDASTHERMYSAFDDRPVISPVPMNVEGKSSRNWTYDAEDVVPSAPPREEEVNALSGAFDAVLTRDDQKALRKAKRDAEKAQEEAEEANRLEQQRQKKEADEARRLQDLADIARVEQERKEAEATALEAKALHYALVQEFQSIVPVVRIAAGLETLEQWLTNPEAWREKIATIMTSAVQPVVQEEESSVTIHTKQWIHIDGLRRQAQKLGIKLVVKQNGNHWCIDILANQLIKLKVFLWKQYIWVSAIEDGFKVQMGRNSYPALMKIMPDVASIVQEAMELQETLDHRKQGLLPQPYCLQYYSCQAMGAYPLVPVPVYGPDGVIMAFQYVASPPLYA
jgi:hypothetical protein